MKGARQPLGGVGAEPAGRRGASRAQSKRSSPDWGKSLGERDKDERVKTTSGTPLPPMTCARCIMGSPSGLRSQEQV